MAGIGSNGWRRALDSLQQAGFEGETLLVGASADAGAGIRRIEAPSDATPQQMRALGFAAAGAERVASLSEDYSITPAWMEAALATVADVTCGPVTVSDQAGYFDRAMWMWEYAHLPDLDQRGAIEGDGCAWIPAGNVVYLRDRMPLELLTDAASEVEVHRTLATAGLSFLREPAMRVEYCPPRLRQFLSDRRRWSRLGAQDRPSLLRALALPPVLLLRQGKHWIGRRGWRLRFLSAIPTFVIFSLAQALGEFDAVLGWRREN